MDKSELQQLFSMAKQVTQVTDKAELLGEIDTGGVCRINLYRDMSRYVYTVCGKANSNWQDNFMQRFNRKV